MPQVTVYIRSDDLDKWKSLEKKTEFIHNALDSEPSIDDSLIDATAVIKTPEDAEEVVVAQHNQSGVQVCKIHSTPLDYRGKCLMKGCQYA